MKKGVFITIEGPEGAGKTTATKRVVSRLLKLGFDVVYTREPGGIEIAEKIREVILNPNHTTMDGRTEALLYAAARRQHLVEVVEPALLSGKIVICDRFIDSSLAYQGHARELGMDEVLKINEFAIDGLMPHQTIFFDVDPEVGLERINRNEGREKNRLDQESLAFHRNVYEGYRKAINQNKKRFCLIDASRSEEKVTDDVLSNILRVIKSIAYSFEN